MNRFSIAAGFQTGMQTSFFGKAEKQEGKVVLHQGFSSRKCDSSSCFCIIRHISVGNIQNFFSRNIISNGFVGIRIVLNMRIPGL